MSVMASWNGKTWGVSPERIAALNGVSASVELDTENSDDKAGSPATKTKALKLQSMSVDFAASMSRGRRWWASTPPSTSAAHASGRPTFSSPA